MRILDFGLRIEISNVKQILNLQSEIRNPKLYSMPIDCHKCIYYFVTWNPSFPHGCRGMGFKSQRYPNDEVRRIMNGKRCLLFTAREEANFQPSKDRSG